MLMTVCTLGADWKDATKIPVAEIIKEWRAQAKRGRYESKTWTCDALEAAVDASAPASSASAPAAASSAARDRPAVLGEFWDLSDPE